MKLAITKNLMDVRTLVADVFITNLWMICGNQKSESMSILIKGAEMIHTITNAIIGGMYGGIISYNLITNDYETVIFAVVGWIALLVHIGTNKGE